MSFWYLCSPYRGYPDGLDAAHDAACALAGQLLDLGIEVYSPIAHSHRIARSVLLAGPRSDFWLERQKSFLRVARGVIVPDMPGWRSSKGVAFEIDFTRWMDKPRHYLPYPLFPDDPKAGAVIQRLKKEIAV